MDRQTDRQIDRQIDRFIYNLKSFSNQRSDSVSKLSSSESSLAFLSSFIYMKHLFILSILFQYYVVRHSSAQVHLKTFIGHSNIPGSQRALGYLESPRRALGHVRHSGTWTPGGYLGNRAPKALGHSDNQDTQALEQSGT